MQRAHFQVHGLDRAEGPFDTGQSLVGTHTVLACHGLLRQGRADDIDAVECSLGGDGVLAPGTVEAGVGDGEVLLHAIAVDHLADAHADLCGAFETALLDALAKVLQLSLGCLQQRLPGAGPAVQWHFFSDSASFP